MARDNEDVLDKINRLFYENVSNPVVGTAVDSTVGLMDLLQMLGKSGLNKAGVETEPFTPVAPRVKQAMGVSEYDPYAPAAIGASLVGGVPGMIRSAFRRGAPAEAAGALAREGQSFAAAEGGQRVAEEMFPENDFAGILGAVAGGTTFNTVDNLRGDGLAPPATTSQMAVKNKSGNWLPVEPELDIQFTNGGPRGAFIEGLEKIGVGSENTVYRRGDRVIKVSEPYNDKAEAVFSSRVNRALEIDEELGDGTLQYLGYYTSPNGVKNPVFQQDFISGRPATRDEIREYMALRGFVVSKTGGSGGSDTFTLRREGKELIATDLDGDNVRVGQDGQVHVIDADLVTRPMGGFSMGGPVTMPSNYSKGRWRLI